MRRHLVPLAVTLSLSVATAALAQSGAGGSSGGGAGGASSGGASTGAAGPAGTTSSSGAAAPATPPASVSPSTEDVAGASRIPRARSGSELGVPQPGDAATATTGSIRSSGSSVVPPSTVDRQSERDRLLNRSLIQGGGVCDGCAANPPAAR